MNPNTRFLILDTLLEGVQVIDFNFRYIYVNDALLEYSQYSRQQLVGNLVTDLYPGVEQTPLFAVLKKCMTDRVSDRLETEFKFPDGAIGYFDLSVQPIPEGILILSVNRTEQRRSAIMVEKNEARFRALIEKSKDMKTLATRDGVYTYTSPAVLTVLGYRPEELIHKSVFNLIHPDDLETFTANRKQILDEPGAFFAFTQRRLHKAGHWIWCEGTVTNLLHEPGIEAMVSNFRDVSERMAAEQQREFDRNNLDALINNTRDLMWSVDRSFKLITSNEPFSDVVNQSGRPIHKGAAVLSYAYSADHANRFRTAYERAFSGETFTITEHTEGRTESWMEISFSPIHKNKEVVGAACHGRDITERKLSELRLINSIRDREHAEAELLEKNAELQKTNSELDRFVYSASHDLRSPLTSILGLVNLLEQESTEPQTTGYCTMIRDSINRLDKFIWNILNHSRNHRADLECSAIPLRKTVEHSISQLRHMKEAAGIQFKVDIDETLVLQTDEQRFLIILDNLISNGIKFQREDVLNKSITVSARQAGDSIVMRVEDSGIGIAPEHHDKIFKMFFRLANTQAGSGIGLYVVKETVEKLKGTIEVQSIPGKGSAFIVTLKDKPGDDHVR